MQLPNDNPDAFETIFGWLFRDPATFQRVRDDVNPFRAMIPIWILADKLIMPRLKNDIMDEIRNFAKQKDMLTT